MNGREVFIRGMIFRIWGKRARLTPVFKPSSCHPNCSFENFTDAEFMIPAGRGDLSPVNSMTWLGRDGFYL